MCKGWTRGSAGGPKGGTHAATVPGRVGPPKWHLEHRLSFSFDVPPHIYEKVGALGRGELS